MAEEPQKPTDAQPNTTPADRVHVRALHVPTVAVILDTNIWAYRNFLLSDALGVALCHIVRKIHGEIVLPDVVEAEILTGA